MFGADLDIRIEGGQDASDCSGEWEHVCCLPGSRQEDVHPECEEVTKSVAGLREAERVFFCLFFSPPSKANFLKNKCVFKGCLSGL